MVCLGILLVLIWIVFYPLTDLFVRFWARNVVREGNLVAKKICLTFDDGPDPCYTPQVLDILRELDVPAVFFLIASKAESAPELVKRIQTEGHEIGLHTLEHRNAYAMFWINSKKSIMSGLQKLQLQTGNTLQFFRPPWGAMNLFQLISIRKVKLQLVLWTIDARDWMVKTGASGIENILANGIKPGSIIVLHDSGGESGAPVNTINALPKVITKFKAAGYQFVGLKDIIEGDHNVRKNDSTSIWRDR